MFNCLVGPSTRAGTGRGRTGRGCCGRGCGCCGAGALRAAGRSAAAGGGWRCGCQYLSHSLVLIRKGLGDAVRTEHLLTNHGSVPLVFWDYALITLALHTSVLILPGPEEPLLAVRM
eukprot:scaffold24002_cov52-Phaeocystis_antarctica.AAC.1